MRIFRFKLHLIEEWRQAWRMWSVRFAAIGTAIMGVLLTYPEIILEVWNTIPADVKYFIPHDVGKYLSLIFFVLIFVSRIIRQEKLLKPDKKETPVEGEDDETECQ